MPHLHPKITIGTKVLVKSLVGWKIVNFISGDRKVFGVESIGTTLKCELITNFTNLKTPRPYWIFKKDFGSIGSVENISCYYDDNNHEKHKIEFIKNSKIFKRVVGCEREVFGTDDFEEKTLDRIRIGLKGVLCRVHKVEY